ncbi:MAG: hypothetical protein K0R12_979, partial [Gammaproteobacteria bacterium]|nr:hypothetical protein [Gammaproteobacteria bacterium]
MFGNNKQTNPTTLAQAEDYRQKAEKYSENNQMIDAAIMYGKAYMQFIELGHRTSAKEDYAQAAKMYRAAADIRKKQGNLAEYVEIIEIAENHDLKEKENQDLKEKYTKVLQHHEKITTHQGWGDNSSDQFKEAAKRFNNALNELLETPGGYKHLKGQKSKLSNSLVKMMEKRNTDIQKNPQLEEMLKLLAGLDENAYPKEGGVVDNRIVENRIVEFKNKALACLEHGKLRADKFYEAKNLLDEIKQFTKEASKTSSVLQRITDPKHANKTAFFAAVKKSTSKQDVASIVAHLKIHQAISLDSISLPHNTESTGHRYQRIDSRIFLPKPGNAKNNYSNLSEKELIEVVRKDANRGTLSFEGIPIPAEQGEEFIQQLKQVDRDLRMAFIRSYNQSTVHGHPFDLVATRVASRETHPFLCGFTTADQRMDVSFRQGKVILTVSVQYGETVMGEPVPEAIVKDGTYLIPGEVVATLEISPGQEGFELVSVYATTETARKIYTGNLDDELIRSSDAKQKEYPRTYGFGLTEAERAAADEKNTEHFQNLNKRHEKWKKKQQKEKIALSAEDLKKVSRVEENGEEKKAVAHMKIESSASVENDLSKDAEVSTIDAESAESEEVEGKDEAAVKQEEILESIELGSSKQEVNEKSYLDAALKQVNFYDEKARQASKEKNYDVAAKIYFEAVEDFNKKGETVFAEIMCGRWAEILVEKAAYQTVISEDKNEMMHWCQQGKEACEFGISIYKNEKPHMVAMFQANYWEFVAFELVLNEKYDDAEEAEQRAKGYRIVQFEQTAQEDESAEQYEAAGKNYALAADLCEESGKYDEEAVNLDEKAALYSRIVLFEKEAKEYIAANQNEAAARKYLAAAELYKQ